MRPLFYVRYILSIPTGDVRLVQRRANSARHHHYWDHRISGGVFCGWQGVADHHVQFRFLQNRRRLRLSVRLSAARIEQAQRIWVDDVTRIRIEEPEAIPDHFKQAAHLAYWLRRRLVTNTIIADEELGGTDLQRMFINYGNEICSFRMAFRLCLGFVTRKLHADQRKALLAKIHLDHDFLIEIAKLLHYKNVSPQSLYLMYKSLFYDLGIPDTTNVVPLAPKR